MNKSNLVAQKFNYWILIPKTNKQKGQNYNSINPYHDAPNFCC